MDTLEAKLSQVWGDDAPKLLPMHFYPLSGTPSKNQSHEFRVQIWAMDAVSRPNFSEYKPVSYASMPS